MYSVHIFVTSIPPNPNALFTEPISNNTWNSRFLDLGIYFLVLQKVYFRRKLGLRDDSRYHMGAGHGADQKYKRQG